MITYYIGTPLSLFIGSFIPDFLKLYILSLNFWDSNQHNSLKEILKYIHVTSMFHAVFKVLNTEYYFKN